MREEKNRGDANNEGQKPERTFNVEDENIITSTGKNASGSAAGSPAGGNYGGKEQPDAKGLPLDASDNETKDMGNNPEAINKMSEQEAANHQSLTNENALSTETPGGSSVQNENRRSSL
jgi:hypothetical protein